MAFVRRTLLDGNARIYDVLDRETVRGLVGEHLRGDTNRRLLIWSLLNVEAWLCLSL
jgi:asparagine synthase (glutamine-hydrolysing)